MSCYTFDLISNATLPQDNGYLVLAGLSKQHPFLHGRQDIQIAPVRGTRVRNNPGLIRLDSSSKLHIRGISEEEAQQIAGSWFLAERNAVCIGEQHEVPVEGASRLVSRLVVLPDVVDPEKFQEALNVLAQATVSLGRRRAFHMKGKRFLGYSVTLTGMSPEQAVHIQKHGIGKFTSMGCGVFYPGTL